MNKYQEAFEKMVWNDKQVKENSAEWHEAIILIQELVDKATPKKPYGDDNGNFAEYFESWFVCPVCGEPIQEDYEFCGSCGQALDWSDDHE